MLLEVWINHALHQYYAAEMQYASYMQEECWHKPLKIINDSDTNDQ